MIKVLFPPGCYGTYLTRCIYAYSNLRQEGFIPLDFDSSGSSHSYRTDNAAKAKVENGHIRTLNINNNDAIISLLPDTNNNLDYFDNQYHKNNKDCIARYIRAGFSDNDISDKLKTNWNYTGSLDTAPRWIIREWCSFWLTGLWKDAYNRKDYTNTNWYTLEVADLVDNFEASLGDIFDYLELTFTVEMSIIKETHTRFLSVQKYHNIQQKCQQWVDATINSGNLHLTNLTIFDEAYIQFLLRDNGYEIYCNDLQKFPVESSAMKKIIYKQ